VEGEEAVLLGMALKVEGEEAVLLGMALKLEGEEAVLLGMEEEDKGCECGLPNLSGINPTKNTQAFEKPGNFREWSTSTPRPFSPPTLGSEASLSQLDALVFVGPDELLIL
jgi:hypothetical protein